MAAGARSIERWFIKFTFKLRFKGHPRYTGDVVIYLRKFAVGINFSANCGWRLGIIFTSTLLFTPNEMSPEDLTSTLQLCYEGIWGAPDISMGDTSEESALKAGRITLSTRPSVRCMVLMCMPCIAKVSLICRAVTAPATNPSSRLPLTTIFLSQIYFAPFSGVKYTFTKTLRSMVPTNKLFFFLTILYRFSFVPSTDSHSCIFFVVNGVIDTRAGISVGECGISGCRFLSSRALQALLRRPAPPVNCRCSLLYRCPALSWVVYLHFSSCCVGVYTFQHQHLSVQLRTRKGGSDVCTVIVTKPSWTQPARMRLFNRSLLFSRSDLPCFSLSCCILSSRSYSSVPGTCWLRVVLLFTDCNLSD